MLNRTILFLLAVLSTAIALPGAALAAGGHGGAVVFSQAVAGDDGPDGGLYAARNGRLNQLTENPADRQPNFSADGRKIAFVRGGDIWAMRADGSGQHALTSGADLDERPLVSPNGRYVAFERRSAADAPRDLYTVRIGGGEAHALVASPLDEREATFAPDGRTIAFVRTLVAADGGAQDDVFSVAPTGSSLRRLTRTVGIDEFAPRWFARGRGIVFSRGKSGDGPGAYADVYIMRNSGRKVRPLVRGAGSAFVEDVGANGRGMLLFRRDQGLWVKRIGYGRVRKLTEVPDGSSTNAVFSSDGRRVAAFVATDEAESLVALDVRTGRATDLASGFSLAGGEVASTIGPVIAWQPVRQARRR